METTKYNVDEAVAGVRPVATVRGQEYPVADFTARQRITLELEYLELQGRLSRLAAEIKTCTDEKRPAKIEEFNQASDEYQIMGVNLVLQGVPEDVARSLTEAEMAGLESMLEHWRGKKIPAEAMLGEWQQADGKQKEG